MSMLIPPILIVLGGSPLNLTACSPPTRRALPPRVLWQSRQQASNHRRLRPELRLGRSRKLELAKAVPSWRQAPISHKSWSWHDPLEHHLRQPRGQKLKLTTDVLSWCQAPFSRQSWCQAPLSRQSWCQAPFSPMAVYFVIFSL